MFIYIHIINIHTYTYTYTSTLYIYILRWVTKAIFKEAYRILKPGGSFTMLDLDKDNLENLLSNPFVAAIYKQTEPYMGEFLSLQPKEDLEEFGFQVTTIGQASRSHRVYVARKPLDAVEIA